MKKKLRRLSSLLLTIMVSLSCMNYPIHAEETNTLPTKEQFATVDELKTFNTNDKDGTTNPAKVYFGQNNQQWWIAGSQNNNLTLFAASPLAENQMFEPDYINDKTYDEDWNCTYSSDTPSNVHANHYGASPLRTTLQGLEKSYFSSSEQALMNNTTIYTNDVKNNSIYSTTNKLYLAYGDYDEDQYITVGTNSEDSLNNGLRIDMKYWGNSIFWLRAPRVSDGNFALIAFPGFYVSSNIVLTGDAVVPAFELNLSSVLFASAVPAASSSGALTANDAFILRYSTDTLGSAQVSYDKSKVNLSNVPSGTYLVVQNSNGAWAKQINTETEVTASDIDGSLTTLENCKVWLETTNDRMTYATLATEEKETFVNISAGTGLSITSNNGVQEVAPNTPITDITVKADNGYYFPDEYVEQLKSQLNGLKVTKVDDYTLTISGIPTNDVITTLSATVLPKADKPEVEITKTSTSIKAVVTNHQDIFGNIEYKWNDENWEQDKNTLSNLQPNTKYQLAVRFTGNGFYQPSDEYSIEITTLQDGNAVIVVPTGLAATYAEGLKLSDVSLLEGWAWVDPDIELFAGIKSYSAAFDTEALENTTDFSNVEGYDETTHKVTRNIEVKVEKADSQVTITTQSLDKLYDGNVVNDPEYTTSGSNGKVTITWQENKGTVDNPEWKDLKSAPSTVGNYRIVVELAGNDNYNGASVEKEFSISITDNEWTEELSIAGWTYGESANTPTAGAKFGDVTYTYSSEETGTYTETVPTEAGTYYVKATVIGNENYTGLESIKEFTIQKAESSISITTQDMNKVYDGKAIENPEVNKTGSTNDVAFTWYQKQADGMWKELDSAPTDVGEYKVVVGVAEDNNYNGASAEKEFSISVADNEWIEELSIKGWTYGESASVPTASAKFGTVEFTYSNQIDGTYTNEVPVNAGTYYVKATVIGNENYKGLESAPVKFEITKATSSIKFKDGTAFDKVYDTNAVVVTEEHIERTGSTGAVSFTFEKKVNDEWEMVETTSEAGTYRVTATLAEDNNYTSATSKPLEFTISKADSQVTITTQSLDKLYDGNVVSDPEYTTSGSDGKVTITWQENKGTVDNPKWKDLKSAPSTVGSYRVVVELAGNDNYNGASAEKEFSISITDNEWTEELSINNWTYGESASVPTAGAKFGDVTYTYSSEETGTYTNEVPVNAGTYYVKATVVGNENYTGLESVVSFEIKKAIPTYEKVTGLVLGQGQPLSKIKLPEQFKWGDETLTADELGTHTFKAIYTPEDTVNYEIIEVDIEVEVVPTPTVINHVPTIHAKNRTIKVGDKFEPLKDVTASDYEDGDLTSKIKVIKNAVDTKKAGTYEVTYQVTDSQGATVTKTIKVTVKGSTNKDDVKTGNQTNAGLFTSMITMSGLLIAILMVLRKKKTINS